MNKNQQTYLNDIRKRQDKAERIGDVKELRQILAELQDFGLKKVYNK